MKQGLQYGRKIVLGAAGPVRVPRVTGRVRVFGIMVLVFGAPSPRAACPPRAHLGHLFGNARLSQAVVALRPWQGPHWNLGSTSTRDRDNKVVLQINAPGPQPVQVPTLNGDV